MKEERKKGKKKELQKRLNYQTNNTRLLQVCKIHMINIMNISELNFPDHNNSSASLLNKHKLKVTGKE